MFERFNDRARRVLVLAQEEARLLDHSFIGTEHLLLGLIREGEGIAAHALALVGISLQAAREKVDEIVGEAGTPQSGSPPFTPRAKKVLELALREALQRSHSYIGTEHLLLGLTREEEGVGATVLRALGADLESVRQETVRLMGGREPEVLGRADNRFEVGHLLVENQGWAPPQWDRPSEGTMPAVLAIEAPVLQSEVVAVAIDRLDVYPNGFAVSLILRVNPNKAREMLEMLGPVGPNRWPHVDVRFPDGRMAQRGFGMSFGAHLPKDEHGIPTGPIVSIDGVSGSGGWRATAWVFPLPPDGPVEIVFGFEGGGVGEASISIDGATVRAAATKARIVWT